MIVGLFFPVPLLVFVFLPYFVPAIVAFVRNHRNRGAIFVLNLLLGWTVLGWVGALVWACTANVEPQIGAAR